jgi:hypothetical protein
MADLSEVSEFPEGVYQIETTDPVIGGAPNVGTGAGMSNIPHLLLANRTRWLKNAVDSIVGGLTNFVTRPQFESTQRPATTEFVRREIGNMRGQITLAASTALTAAHTGMRLLLQTNGTITLPSLASVPAGTAFLLIAASGFTPTIQAAGADVLHVSGSASAVVLPSRGTLYLVAGPGTWNGDMGDYALTRSPLFDATLTTSGCQRLPSGLIMQWGQLGAPGSLADETIPVTFPIAFPTACFQAFAHDPNNVLSATQYQVSAHGWTTTGMSISYHRTGGAAGISSINWVALGN